MTQLLVVIGLVMSAIIGLWKWWGRKAQYRRDQADKAKETLDEAQKNNDAPGRVSAWNRINRLQ